MRKNIALLSRIEGADRIAISFQRCCKFVKLAMPHGRDQLLLDL